MGRVNSDVHYFLEEHEQEIINSCKKAMSNKEIIELLKTKYGREVRILDLLQVEVVQVRQDRVSNSLIKSVN